MQVTFIDRQEFGQNQISMGNITLEGMATVIGTLQGSLCFLGFSEGGVVPKLVAMRMFKGCEFMEMSAQEESEWEKKITKDPENLKIILVGTEFNHKVWKQLLKIEKLTTYGEIAKQIDCKSYRAVGSAIGHNPISLIVPCHRVIRSNGQQGGYLWGVKIKEQLLKKESLDSPSLSLSLPNQ